MDNARPLTGRTVLLTRASKDADELRGLLQRYGARVGILPTIAIEPLDDLSALDAALRDLRRYRWVFLTSRNAGAIMLDRLSRLDVAVPPDLRVGVVGEGTATLLRNRGVEVSLVGAGGAGDLASRLIPGDVANAEVLFLCAAEARDELPAALAALGAAVHRIPVYRTVAPPPNPLLLEALREGTIDIVMLASPSALRNLLDMLGGNSEALARTHIVCIGTTTAHAVCDAGLTPAAVAAVPTPGAFADAAAELYGNGERR